MPAAGTNRSLFPPLCFNSDASSALNGQSQRRGIRNASPLVPHAPSTPASAVPPLGQGAVLPPPSRPSNVVAADARTESSLLVAVRLRPMPESGGVDILRECDGRMVVVLDPDTQKSYLDEVQNRTKERRYTFDRVFGKESTNQEVFQGTVAALVADVVKGFSATVFAYGATGAGKTHTMVGTPQDPGLMVIALQSIFHHLATDADPDFDHQVTCSYLEVYNEMIYDLLVQRSSALELREDPHGGVRVAGLTQMNVRTCDDLMHVLEAGNRRRKTEATRANATSSRSHAVFEITLVSAERNQAISARKVEAKLSMVDLAGSERAAETGNSGHKMRDGGNINRSLLALANCINKLGKAGGNRPLTYVPFRDSKLTRLLKDGLIGNSRTCMLAMVTCKAEGYHNTVNTLKYADRAKEIKTQVRANVGSVETHVAEYQKIISELQAEVAGLKQRLQLSHFPSGRAFSPGNEVEGDWQSLQHLLEQLSQNAEERVNLQQAMFEVDEQNRQNASEVDLVAGKMRDPSVGTCNVPHLQVRLQELKEAISVNKENRAAYQEEMRANQLEHSELQSRLKSIAETGTPNQAQQLLATHQRLQSAMEIELKFQIAVRDQVIAEQRAAVVTVAQHFDKLKQAERIGVADAAKLTQMMASALMQHPPSSASTQTGDQTRDIMAKLKSDSVCSSKQAPVLTPRRELSGPTSHPPSSSPRQSLSTTALSSQFPCPATPLGTSFWRPQSVDGDFADSSTRSDEPAENGSKHPELLEAVGDARLAELAAVQGGGCGSSVELSGQSYRAAMQPVSTILQNHSSLEEGKGLVVASSGVTVDESAIKGRTAEVAEVSRHNSRTVTGHPSLHSTHTSLLGGEVPHPSHGSGHYSKMFSIPKFFLFRWMEKKVLMSDVQTIQEVDSRTSERSERSNRRNKVRWRQKGTYQA